MRRPDGFDPHANAAIEAIPHGYGRVAGGKIRPDDLLWSWPTQEWIRADSSDWVHAPPEDASDAVCVIRTGRPNPNAGWGATKQYKISRELTQPKTREPSIVKTAANETKLDDHRHQLKLFG